jgi:hypothetical protein
VRRLAARARTIFAALLLLLLSACTGPGVDAGEEGGVAFILFTIMLLLTVGILWFFLGRED